MYDRNFAKEWRKNAFRHYFKNHLHNSSLKHKLDIIQARIRAGIVFDSNTKHLYCSQSFVYSRLGDDAIVGWEFVTSRSTLYRI